MAEEKGAIIGHEVGYAIRFEDCTDPEVTKVKVREPPPPRAGEGQYCPSRCTASTCSRGEGEVL